MLVRISLHSALVNSGASIQMDISLLGNDFCSTIANALD